MKQLEEDFFVSGQIRPQDVADLAAQGVRMIINNRPDGEVPEQPDGTAIAAAAEQAGIAYRPIPVRQLDPQAVEETQRALTEAEGPVLAFCAVGTRSTYLWALARSRQGADGDRLAAQAEAAGYDLTPIRRFLR